MVKGNDEWLGKMKQWLSVSVITLFINVSLLTMISIKTKQPDAGGAVLMFIGYLFSATLVFSGAAMLAGFLFGLLPYSGLEYKRRVIRAGFLSFIIITGILSVIYVYYLWTT